MQSGDLQERTVVLVVDLQDIRLCLVTDTFFQFVSFTAHNAAEINLKTIVQ